MVNLYLTRTAIVIPTATLWLYTISNRRTKCWNLKRFFQFECYFDSSTKQNMNLSRRNSGKRSIDTSDDDDDDSWFVKAGMPGTSSAEGLTRLLLSNQRRKLFRLLLREASELIDKQRYRPNRDPWWIRTGRARVRVPLLTYKQCDLRCHSFQEFRI